MITFEQTTIMNRNYVACDGRLESFILWNSDKNKIRVNYNCVHALSFVVRVYNENVRQTIHFVGVIFFTVKLYKWISKTGWKIYEEKIQSFRIYSDIYYMGWLQYKCIYVLRWLYYLLTFILLPFKLNEKQKRKKKQQHRHAQDKALKSILRRFIFETI